MCAPAPDAGSDGDRTQAATIGTDAIPHGSLHGVLAAALTPLRDGGEALDGRALGELADLYAEAGLDGVMVAGTTGEGLLLSRGEREHLAEGFVEAADGRFKVAVHAGAQTTAEAVALALHARERGAVAVTAMAPPFFAFDDAAQIAYFREIADACAPLSFYLYEIRPRTGYAIPVQVVEAVREATDNLVGMKVSDPTLEELARYFLEDFDILVGVESLIKDALALGAVGTVSALAGAMPRQVVRALADPGDRGGTLGPLRAGLERYPFHAAGKLTLVAQSVTLALDVRAPLRQLTPSERTELEDWLAGVLTSYDGALAP